MGFEPSLPSPDAPSSVMAFGHATFPLQGGRFGGYGFPTAPMAPLHFVGRDDPGAPNHPSTSTRPSGGEVGPPPLPVPPAEAMAGAGPQRGRKDESRRRSFAAAPHSSKSPFFFGFQKPFLFPAGKKKWVLSRLSRPRTHPHPSWPSAMPPSPCKGEGLADTASQPRPWHHFILWGATTPARQTTPQGSPSSVWPSASHLPPRGRPLGG